MSVWTTTGGWPGLIQWGGSPGREGGKEGGRGGGGGGKGAFAGRRSWASADWLVGDFWFLCFRCGHGVTKEKRRRRDCSKYVCADVTPLLCLPPSLSRLPPFVQIGMPEGISPWSPFLKSPSIPAAARAKGGNKSRGRKKGKEGGEEKGRVIRV
jgi:hypothetical protein